MDSLLALLPDSLQSLMHLATDTWHVPESMLVDDAIEIVLDLGRQASVRFPDSEVYLRNEVTDEDLQHVISRIGKFGDDDRAGITKTLHRISAIRNRQGRVVGLTLRVGRPIRGNIEAIRRVIESGQSVLLLGKPGAGKTTMLREVARTLADECHKRVIIVDTSNEIAGDGDIPHEAIGHARRMQVASTNKQYRVMISACENHMPEAIIIDEISTLQETEACRTIAERGVQLVATAHGNTLENLIKNPTLADLIGGVATVTIGDAEAKKRGTSKSVQERKAPPTFTVVVEIEDWYNVRIHYDVAAAVDRLLRGAPENVLPLGRVEPTPRVSRKKQIREQSSRDSWRREQVQQRRRSY